MGSETKGERVYLPADRFVVGSVLVFLMFLVTVILVYIDVSGSALTQGSVFGTVAVLPYKHMKAALEGQAVSGVLASLANIISIATSSSPTVNGLVYFLVALCFITITAALFLVLPKINYFNYYWSRKNNQDQTKDPSLEGINNEHGSSLEPIVSENKIGVLSSMRETFLPGICALITLMITLSLFPAIVARIRPITVIPSDPWTNVYFVPVIIFLLYNVGDWCGRTMAGFVKWPRRNQMLLVLFLCLLRAASIPICMLCNAQPRSYLPVVFKHDIFPALMVLILGLTNGYLVSISMIHGPTFASPGNQESAGAALSIYLSFGLSFGVAISVGISQIL
ncbi:hypothetical protein MN116_000954 [Schistosoma mekongi]|uniref:Equilibrative nucleoside transporter n=1 Tax=Schistosoma mekongi TaxID=38744 RepID=A0AAE1ZLX7_SCHME|nr:hypothetical protein MN116_000954 [Schistosoma mekongi]